MKLKLFLLLFNSMIIIGQPIAATYEPFEFEGYTPKWIHLAVDSTNVGDTLIDAYKDTILYDGWSQLVTFSDFGTDLIQSGDAIYSAKASTRIGFEGGFLEKIDLETGNAIWKSFYDHRDLLKKEIPLKLYEKSDGNIGVIGNRLYNNGSFLSQENTLVVRDYDKSNGQLLKHSYGNENDTLTKITRSPINTRFNKTYYYPYQRYYQYIEIKSGKDVYNSYILDENGILINEEHLRIEFDSHEGKYSRKASALLELGSEKYIGYRFYGQASFSIDSFDVFIDILDRDFGSVRSMNINESLGDSDDFRLESSTDDTFIILEKLVDSVNNRNLYNNTFKLFDIDETLIETIKMVDDKGWVLDLAKPKAIKLKNDKGMLIMTTAYNFVEDGYSSLNIYKSDGHGNLDTVKIIKVKDTNHSIGVDHILQLENGDILLECRDVNEKYENELGGLYGTLLIYFPAEDLGVSTGVEEVSVNDQLELKLYPNPSKDFVVIEFEEERDGEIEIFDTTGKTVKSIVFKTTQKLNVEVKDLVFGLYTIKFKTLKRYIASGKFVKN